MYGEIFIKEKNKQTLMQFVDSLKEILNLHDIERRESGFYIDNEYYSVKAFGVNLKIYIADDNRFIDYHYCVFIDLKDVSIDKDATYKKISELICNQLLMKKYEIIIPETVYTE